MHSISENEGARMMAQWRATGGSAAESSFAGGAPATPGGAIEAQAFEAAGDDRLGVASTRAYPCHVEDGLSAAQFTTDMHPYARCSGDDGLRAYTPTKPHINCAADDGLKAAFTVASGGGICTDDGLTATQVTVRGGQWCTDDGLQAVQFTVASGGGICVDEGLAAVQFTTDMHPYARCSGDDGLEAMGHTLGGGPWCADDGLQAGSPTGMHIPGVCAGDGLAQ